MNGTLAVAPRPRFLPRALLAALLGACVAGPAAAQFSGDDLCALEPEGPNGVSVLRCPGGLAITAEAGAAFVLADGNGDGTPDGASLTSGALLIEGGAFEVSTPEAIAAVRGTTWAIEVLTGKTSVFVQSGAVDVVKSRTAANVRLADGEGVDVDERKARSLSPAPGDEPSGGSGAGAREGLTVKRWPEARVNALFARFGR